MNSILSSDSDNSLLSQNFPGSRRNGSSNSFFNMQNKKLCPVDILRFSIRRTQNAGSATATLCVLNNKELTALNLGDSGFVLIRFDSTTGEPYILTKSKEQTHKFNTPFQLTKLPSEKEIINLRMQNKRRELESLKKALKDKIFFQDQPEQGDIYHMRVRDGDMVILATDGLFDNLFQEEILDIVKSYSRDTPRNKMTANILARKLCDAAFHRSKQTNVKTPFNCKKAQFINQEAQKLIKGNNKAKQDLFLQKVKLHSKDEDINEESITIESNFESLCYGKGKTDDITAAVLWISNPFNSTHTL